MWDAYAAAHPVAVAASPDYTVEHFGDSKRLANELLGVVLSGRKRATAELVADYIARGDQVPRIGSHWIACDGEGLPRIIIRALDVTPRLGVPFADDPQSYEGHLSHCCTGHGTRTGVDRSAGKTGSAYSSRRPRGGASAARSEDNSDAGKAPCACKLGPGELGRCAAVKLPPG
jgi:hypothetical protein